MAFGLVRFNCPYIGDLNVGNYGLCFRGFQSGHNARTGSEGVGKTAALYAPVSAALLLWFKLILYRDQGKQLSL